MGGSALGAISYYAELPKIALLARSYAILSGNGLIRRQNGWSSMTRIRRWFAIALASAALFGGMAAASLSVASMASAGKEWNGPPGSTPTRPHHRWQGMEPSSGRAGRPLAVFFTPGRTCRARHARQAAAKSVTTCPADDPAPVVYSG